MFSLDPNVKVSFGRYLYFLYISAVFSQPLVLGISSPQFPSTAGKTYMWPLKLKGINGIRETPRLQKYIQAFTFFWN